MDRRCSRCGEAPWQWRGGVDAKTKAGACVGCGKALQLCSTCANVFVACSEDCLAQWRVYARKGLPVEKLTQPAGVAAKAPKGVAVHQADMFERKAPLC